MVRCRWSGKAPSPARGCQGGGETPLGRWVQGESPRAWFAKPQHHAALPYAEMSAFIAALRMRDGVAARALEFTILTAARTGEVVGARWDEIDLTNDTWTVPGDRMKAGREHRVPLSDEAIEIPKALPREKDNPYVFIGPRAGGLSNMAMAAVLRRMVAWTSRFTGFGGHSGTGQRRAPRSRPTLSKWRLLTRSATRLKPLTGAAIF